MNKSARCITGTIFLLLTCGHLYIQTCSYADLSNRFGFETTITRFKKEDGPDSCVVKILISNR